MVFNRFALSLMGLLFLSGCATTSTTDPEIVNEPIRYEYEFEDMDSEEIHRKSRLWIGEVFNSAEAVISLDDPESGVLRGSGISAGNYMMFERQFRYNVLIESRDGKSRISFSSFRLESRYSSAIGGPVGGLDPTSSGMYEVIKSSIDDLAKTYEPSINSNVEGAEW